MLGRALESFAVLAVYGVILSGAIQLSRINGSRGWHRAWRAVQLMAGFIILSRLCSLLAVFGVPELDVCMHPVLGRVRSYVAAIAWLCVMYELMRIFSRRVP